MESIIKMTGICKDFPGVKALDGGQLELFSGEIHAVSGENGAGKSTLMKILAGMYTPDSGEIYVEGTKVQFNSMHQALAAGISMVTQELTPVLDMCVYENVYLGREYCSLCGTTVMSKKQKEATAKLFKSLDIDINPSEKMRNLSVAELQLVEIAKAISMNPKVIIMDEPTSALSDREVTKLFVVLRRLRSQGTAIVYISHKMDEIMQICDRITIMRDGKFVDSRLCKDFTMDEIIKKMVGRELGDTIPRIEKETGNISLEVKDLSNGKEFNNVSLEVKSGEILGIAGLMGAGRTELVETIFGLRKKASGDIILNGQTLSIKSPKDAIDNGIVLVPEDRKNVGLNLIGSVRDNIVLPTLKKYCKFGRVSNRLENDTVKESIKKFKIATPSSSKLVKFLSGGNQQKIVIAKWLIMNTKVVIMDEPTRGIDIGAKYEIYEIINQLAKNGVAVIIVSSEMPEIIGISDRIMVMNEGHMVGELTENITQESIMSLITESEVSTNAK